MRRWLVIAPMLLGCPGNDRGLPDRQDSSAGLHPQDTHAVVDDSAGIEPPTTSPTQETGGTASGSAHTGSNGSTGDTGPFSTGDTGPLAHTGLPLHTGDTGPVADTADDGLISTTWSASAPPPCADPLRRLDGYFDRIDIPRIVGVERNLIGSGVIAVDLSDDGTTDLLMAAEEGPVPYLADAGGYVIAPDLLPAVEMTNAVGGSVADYDGDGDLDLFVTRFERTNVLLRNDGGGTWTDATTESGLALEAHRSVASSWADIDGDGDLDLSVGNYGPGPEAGFVSDRPSDPSELWRNEGDGTFTDIHDQLPPEIHDGFVFMFGWFDLHGDGLPELFSLHDFGFWRTGSRLLYNDPVLGLVIDDASRFHPSFNGMGLGAADLNGDGIPDIAQTSASTNSLLLSQPDAKTLSTWSWPVEWSRSLGFKPDVDPSGQQFGWGLMFADVDNDGDEDIPVNYGWWDEYPGIWEMAHDALFINEGGNYTDRAPDPLWAVDDPGAGRGLVAADLNGDGWIDLAKRQLNSPNLVYLGVCGVKRWVGLSLEQPGMNRHAVGARVTATTATGRQTRWVVAGSTSMFSGTGPRLHIGLGAAESVDLEVRWPDGALSRLASLPVDHHLTITRSE
jgi:enediyne biosynthesis protein E4